jgi:MFS family permease
MWAIGWHLFHLTGKSTSVGAMGLVRVVPLLLLGLFGGFVADQFDRRGVILVSNVAQALISIGLAVITIIGWDYLWMLYAAVGLGAVLQALGGPARQAMVPSLIPAADFPNAASVNGIQWRLSEVLGPMFVGLIITAGAKLGINGLSFCYSVNAFSFVAMMIAVWMIPRRPVDPSLRASSPREMIAMIGDGFRFIRQAPVLRNAMFIDFWATFLSGANALFPAFATQILHRDAEGYGILGSSMGLGALAASMVLASLRPIERQGAWVIGMILSFGIGTIGFGISPSLWTACIFLAITGASDMISTVLRQTIRQLATPDHMRGRMSAISMLFHVPGPQLGDFEAGYVGDTFGTRLSIVTGGLGAAGVALWYWLRKTPLSRYTYQDALATAHSLVQNKE